MFHGGPIVRLATTMTMGRRSIPAAKTFSAMYRSPLEELAVKERAPAKEAPMQTAMALCSDSTATKLPLLKLVPMTCSMISV